MLESATAQGPDLKTTVKILHDLWSGLKLINNEWKNYINKLDTFQSRPLNIIFTCFNI